MRWQKIARLAIAAFVIAFAAVVFVALRRPAAPEGHEATPRSSPDAVAEIREGSYSRTTPDGGVMFTYEFKSQLTFADGRTVLKEATIILPERDGRAARVIAGEMEALAPADGAGELGLVKATEGVRLETGDGLVVTSAEATYDEKSGMLTMPGAVQFTRGRLTGSGVGATYDRDRDVLWLLDRASIEVAPDETGGGAVRASAQAAGLARADHYIRLAKDAHVSSDGRTLGAQEMTIQLTPDDRAVRSMALRGESRITGATGSSAAESMAARDIDLTYAPDGRTLQQARLMEDAVVQLAGGPAARRVAGRTIDVTMGPDGSTVTALDATERVQVDLPAAAGNPARRINAAALTAGGGAGLQTATFTGGVTYVELQAGGQAGAAADRTACSQTSAERQAGGQAGAAGGRTACSQTLVIETEPGLGDIRQADFRGHVRIVDGATAAEGRRAVYRIAGDSFDLVPSPADPGPPSTVDDGRVVVSARRITFTVGTRKLHAETDVRSSLQPAARAGEEPAAGGTAGGGGVAEAGKLPSLLKQDEPVNVTSKQLDYDGSAGTATYTGDALLFQGQTSIRAETIVVDDRTANLTASGGVRSVMHFEETDSRTKTTKPVQTMATGDTLVYEDAGRLATYTSGPTAKAHVVGTQGDVTADRIQLFLKEGSNELDRAEADGRVTVKEGPRTATGEHLTYTPANETYVMTGQPVEIEERTPDGCRLTSAASVTFRRTNVDMTISSNGISPVTITKCAGK